MSRWWSFWFEPSSAEELGVSRVLFFTGLLLMYAPEDFSAWGTVSSTFWFPIPAFAALKLTPMSADILGMLETTWKVALGLSAAGCLTRVSMWVSAVLGFYLLGLPHNFGHVYHFDALLVIVCVIMACSRAGDALAIDRLVGTHPRRQPGWEYTWPSRAVWVAMSLVFFAAGVAKLRYGGIEWVMSDTMPILLMRAAYHASDADPITQLGLWVAGYPWLARTIAALSLTIELAFPLSLFSRSARIVLVPGAALMLVGIRVLMGPTFGGFLIANVFWVPWRGLVDWAFITRAHEAPQVARDTERREREAARG